jgi:hypothetical protein
MDVLGETNASLVVSNVHLAETGDYTVVVSNDFGAVTSVVAVLSMTPELADVLDTPGWQWSTSGNGLWYGQTNVTHDGVDAAQSGWIGYWSGRASILDSVVRGPGVLTFWWKVSSEPNHDWLRFFVNGIAQAAISGEVQWNQKTFHLGAGTNQLRWAYSSEDGNIRGGQDAGWVDEVVFTPTLQLAAVMANGSLCLQIRDSNGQAVAPERVSRIEVCATTNLSPNMNNWLRLTNSLALTNGVLLLADPEAAVLQQRFYRVLEHP